MLNMRTVLWLVSLKKKEKENTLSLIGYLANRVGHPFWFINTHSDKNTVVFML